MKEIRKQRIEFKKTHEELSDVDSINREFPLIALRNTPLEIETCVFNIDNYSLITKITINILPNGIFMCLE